VQIDADAAEYWPAGQTAVTADRPVVAQYDPAVHVAQEVDPVEARKDPERQLEQLVEDAEGEYVPAKQFEQVVDDAEDANFPDEQLEQTVDEVAEYEPAAHAPVNAVRPVVAQYDPAVHDKQLQEPVVA